ncbi:MAG TPA: serine hydrolase domain-containing protein, partial [Tepidisphaeraceae bacterium]|nr:serine hydrolase domain-containing protein [Tepidisphaeraceae bacterium]
VFGRDLSRLANEYLFQPLRMTHARFGPLPDSPDIAGSHMPQTGAVDNIEVRTVGRPLGNAGLFVTAPDLARFSRAMLSKDPLGQTLAIGTTSRTRPPLPPRGLLWSLDPGAPHRPRSFSERAFGHGGYTGTALWIDPSGERFAVILTNRTHRPEPGHNDQQKPAQERRLAQAADAYFAAM